MYEEELIEEENKPRTLKVIISLFILTILIFYLATNPLMRYLFSGLIESSKVEGNIINVNQEIKIIFENDAYNKLIKIYSENLGLEFKACFLGEIKSGSYIIKEIFQPKIIQQSFDMVEAELCPEESLVVVHSHPRKHCLPSKQDLDNYENLKEGKSEVLMAVMCDKARFNFYM